MTLIYLSGPMTNYPEFNYPAFNAKAAELRAFGYDVINPAESLSGETHHSYTDYLRRDIESVLECDLVVLLDGWEKSAGSHLEVAVAVGVGIPVALADDMIDDEFATYIFDRDEGRDALAEIFVKDPSGSVLTEAESLVHGDRGADYGHPFHDFSRTAMIWSAILGIPITAEQVALCMVGLKISREVNRPKRDNRVDIAGYAETLEMVNEYRTSVVTEARP
ncbi:Protein of unknown function DUF4406 [uncultured Caudovirales phage]|uniref:DUF6378 domain-containing protein n=1 Tax=uncultured Caudovirales phage TaxID=2100421 RepID=A0A6J5SSS0_9CAUD|nr:Protein of unknown function DUF4406 [uncultured Caudovirales phage]